MKRILLILSCLLLTIGPVLAATDGGLLAALDFGAAPSADMLCTAGPCAGGKIALSHRASTQKVSFYKKPTDLTHIDGVEITAPVYAYHQEQLFQVAFKLIGPVEQGDLLIDALLNAMPAPTLIFNHFDAGGSHEGRQSFGYLLGNGWLLNASRTLVDGRWQAPHIQLYEPGRMDEVRLAFNPSYQPHDD
ncbi:MAG: hypothetical protein RBT64_05590 [Trichloromonas sp.]|jgi:hypothetical protein|nr:hypothetical protein [Trichloromonas sp.]